MFIDNDDIPFEIVRYDFFFFLIVSPVSCKAGVPVGGL